MSDIDINYLPTAREAMLRLADVYAGTDVHLRCDSCDEEVWTGTREELEQGVRDYHATLVELLEHTAFEHAHRANVIMVRTSVELRWER